MRLILSEIILPLPVCWLLITIGIILYWRKKQKASLYLMGISILWLLLVTTPFIPNLLVKHLENRYEVFSLKTFKNYNNPVNILVLGGGHTDDNRLPANNRLSETALARLIEGIRIQRLIPGSTLITSGYKGSEEITQAGILANTAIILGVDSSKIKLQKIPGNTWQEASEYKRLFGDSTRLILVTSAIHMPRAMFLFKKAGLSPLAAPADYLVKIGKQHDSWIGFPSSNNLRKMESAIHEYAGILYANIGQ